MLRHLALAACACSLALLAGCGDVASHVKDDLGSRPDAESPRTSPPTNVDADDVDASGGTHADGGLDATLDPADAAPTTDASGMRSDAGASDAGADARVVAGDASSDATFTDANSSDASSFDASVNDASANDASANDANGSDASLIDANVDAAQPSRPASSALPVKGGTCPQFVSGDVYFAPTGIAQRKVRLWVGASGGGPLVIYWHSTNNQPSEAETSALVGVLSEITAAGGVVAAPYTGANDGTYPWLSTTTESLKVADEVVACAIEQKSIDTGRIHVLGFSAGGLMTSTMSMQRSRYVASAVPYSGGLQSSTAFQDASNKFPALIFHGGTNDTYVLNFKNTSLSYSAALRANGNYTAVCDHGGGHAIPSAGPVAAWRFFQDHRFGTNPSPYVAAGLPISLPNYCVAQP